VEAPVGRDHVVRAIDGDREAYSELVRQSIDRSYALASLVLRDPDRARDATQEAYVAAWRGLSSLRDPDRFEPWLRRLVVRACYQEVRREQRHRHVGVVEIDVGGIAPDPAAQFGDRDQLARAFRRLPPDQRAVLVLRHFLDLTLEETADALGVPTGTAKSRLHRATSALRAALEADERAPILVEGPMA
jgi:RNA polymerase sigma-70 factor (ECF subfamily)